MVVMDDGQDISCVGRDPARGSAPSDDVERVDDTAESRRDADEQRDAARDDRWARCLVNMVWCFKYYGIFLWSKMQ